jgi:hypothetical protein
MEKQWYFNRGPKRFGPFSSAQLKQLAADGKLRPTDLIWKEGMPQPVPAGQASALFPNAAAKRKTAGGESSSMPWRASVTTSTMRAAGGKDGDSPKQPFPPENEQAEFGYRMSMRKLIAIFTVFAACGAFFVYEALCGNLHVVGIPLPEEIGKPILWAIAVFFFLAPGVGDQYRNADQRRTLFPRLIGVAGSLPATIQRRSGVCPPVPSSGDRSDVASTSTLPNIAVIDRFGL